ncbi:hypothetical protein [Streptomyces sp. NPDC060002]|uniref:hypothetical protein n=1 Tax=Streptomyces sp. NPDC060002 TaxID=3347033 RepID=UPI0036874CD7
MSAKSRASAALAAASIGGSLLVVGTAPPTVAAVELGTVTYSGTVSCDARYPAPATSVPVKVTLTNGPKKTPRTASDTVENDGARAGDYGPTDLVVPLDSKFQLRVTVSCKPAGQNVKTFNRQIEQTDLTDEQVITLDIK